MKDYKDTLQMPKTEFEMRGNLTQKEPNIRVLWEKQNLYKQMVEKSKDKEAFILHDGPPYANGQIHIGHALNKILKDVVVRSHFKLGFHTPFTPGWDTHGLPIETAIVKEGVNRKSMSVAEFRELCKSYALKQVNLQMEDMKRLGTLADYDDPYITLKPEYEAEQVRLFSKMALSGMIYKGLKPVYWSYSSESALAEAEIEYHPKKDPAIYVSFEVKKGKGKVAVGDYFVIWTTTPWTIPANLAIALNPTFEYAIVQTSKGRLIVYKDFVDTLMKEFELQEYQIVDTFLGESAEFVETIHPLYPEKTSIIILGEHVDNEAGTGCVHTAPGHGVEDFEVGSKYGLDAYCPVDEQGKMMESAGEGLAGVFIEDANKIIIQRLFDSGHLLKLSFINHSYPHDWRTKKPVIFRATLQWFASIEQIRTDLLREIEKVNWVPAWGQLRMHNMIKDRGDWCISRQRAWGVPIPIFYGEDKTPILDEVLFEHIATLFEKHGSNIWFEKEAGELLPEGYTHPSSPNNIFKKETDIMDVWFDSGSSHTGAFKHKGQSLPVDLYLEGSDQYRGWFNSSLIISTAVYNHAPYKQVLSHGFVLDGNGEKMSKSQGNVVDPNKVINTLGADILRLWVMSTDYQSDVRISDDILKQTVESYRKIRNTFRFMLANLTPIQQVKDQLIVLEKLPAIDRHVLFTVNQKIQESLEHYKKYEYALITQKLNALMNNLLSAYYLDFTKDILYIEKEDALRRRQVQTVLYHTLKGLALLVSPMLVFTTEELWQHFSPESKSVHLELFETFEVPFSSTEAQAFDRLMDFRDDVFKALELLRNQKVIGKSLEAHVIIHAPQALKQVISDYIGVKQLAQWLIVSKVSFVESELTPYPTCQLKVEKADGHACPRCWNITTTSHDDHLCDRCVDVLSK